MKQSTFLLTLTLWLLVSFSTFGQQFGLYNLPKKVETIEQARNFCIATHEFFAKATQPMVLEDAKNLDKAIAILESQTELNKLDRDTLLAKCYTMHANNFFLGGKYQLAIKDIEKSEFYFQTLLNSSTIIDSIGKYGSYSAALSLIGGCYQSVSDYDLSALYYDRARYLVERFPEPFRSYYLSQTLAIQSSNFLAINQLPKADSYGLKALKLIEPYYKKTQNSDTVARKMYLSAAALSNAEAFLADAFYTKKDSSQARAFMAKSFEHAKQAEASPLYEMNANIIKARSFIMASKHEPSKQLAFADSAIGLLQKSLQLKGNLLIITVAIHANLGIAYFLKNQLDSASFYIQQGMSIGGYSSQSLLDNPKADIAKLKISPDMLAALLLTKASILKKYYDQNDSLVYLEGCLKTCQSAVEIFNNPVLNNDLKLSYGSHQQSSFNVAAKMALRVFKKTNIPGLMELSFRYCEQGKNFTIRQMLTKSRLNLLGNNQKDNFIKTERAILDSIRAIRKPHRPGYMPNDPENKQLIALEKSYRSLIEYIKQSNPRYYTERFDTTTVSMADIQKKLLDDTTAVISYMQNDDSIRVFVISKSTKTYVTLALVDNFWQQFDIFLKHTGDEYVSTKKWEEVASFMFNALLKDPLSKLSHEKIRKLIIVPDGVLGNLSFGAFIDPQSNTYVFEKYIISYTYSMTTYQMLYDLQRDMAEKGMYQSKQFMTFIANYDEAKDALPQLTREAQELTTRHFKNGMVFPKATKNEFADHAPKADFLHLVAHGKLEPEVMSHYLAFSKEIFDASKSGSKSIQADVSNHLTVADIASMTLKARIVVLGSCNTGRNTIQGSYGISTIARAFSAAGCLGLVATLNSVSDNQTAKIHRYFYENLIEKQQPTDVALTYALRRYLVEARKDKEKSHLMRPHFWANVVFVGKAVTISR